MRQNASKRQLESTRESPLVFSLNSLAAMLSSTAHLVCSHCYPSHRANTSRSCLTPRELPSGLKSPTTSSKKVESSARSRTSETSTSSTSSLKRRRPKCEVGSLFSSFQLSLLAEADLSRRCAIPTVENFGIQGPESYVYTSKSGCLDVASIDDKEDFAETLKAMNVVGLSADEQEQIFRCLAMVLWYDLPLRFPPWRDGDKLIFL
jgi:hypothetical protein